ncbi:MAG TPA: hypothetical protein VGN10_13875 [Pyrinomonadaceae bacterium]
MKAIKIIKPNKSGNEATENKKTVEPSTRKIANTVKSWIEESQQRRRNQPRALTVGVALRGHPLFESALFMKRAATEGRPYSWVIDSVRMQAF